MTGRELEECLHYTGMIRAIRKLALTDKLADAEKLAVMTTEEVCNLVVKKYDVLSAGGERLILVPKENMEKVLSLVRMIDR